MAISQELKNSFVPLKNKNNHYHRDGLTPM